MAKQYINGILIKEIKTQYGSLLNVSIKKDDFIQELQKHNNNGWVNLTISERKEPSDKGYTHTCFLNEFKKDPNYKKEEPHNTDVYNEPEDNSDMPF